MMFGNHIQNTKTFIFVVSQKSNVIIPVTIMQLQNALESTVPGDGVNIDGIEVNNVC